MRKFKLKDQVARKMRGLENTGFPVSREGQASEQPEASRAEVPDAGFRVISRTDIGLVRKSNQDALILGKEIFGVADGMGGHNGGETASTSARDSLLRETDGAAADPACLEKAIRKANRDLWEMQLGNESLSGMGTTLTVLWPMGEEVLIGHVGDSRAYLWRDGELHQVTADHSMVADMVRRGMLTEEQAACHPMRNYITRAVGSEETIEPDILSVPREKGDRWLICSDGLHGLVPRERLAELMGAEDLNNSADQMIRETLDLGARDNVSLVIAEDLTSRVREDETPQAADPEASDDLEKTRIPEFDRVRTAGNREVTRE